MKLPYRYELPTVVLAGVVLFPAFTGCSSSDSAEQSAETSESATNSSNTSTSDNRSSSDAASEDRPELRELEGDTKRLKARTQILEIKGEMQSHLVMSDAEELPEALSEWADGKNAAFDDPKILEDPWGNQYIYRKTGEDTFELYSAGPDGEPETDDDVRPEESE